MIRADQVGSFLRPADLLEARAAFSAGLLDGDMLREREDRAIEDVLRMQRQTGIDILTDGEFRRSGFQSELLAAVDGFEQRAAEPTSAFFGAQGRATRLVVTQRLRQHRRLAQHEASYLLAQAGGAFKITLPTPFQFLNFVDGVTDRAYADRGELLRDLAAIVAGEVRALLDEGVGYVQIDAPRYSYFIDPDLARQFKASGADPSVSLDEVIAADNACLGVVHAPQVTTALHVCRGNNRSMWYAEGGYDAIAERLFTSLQVDRFLLEYDDERAGSFEPLRFVPPNKTVVLGLVTTKFDRMEDPDDLCRRIDAAARYVPLDQLALSPQCGFASMMDGNLIDADTQRRKLELVVQTARRVWGG